MKARIVELKLKNRANVTNFLKVSKLTNIIILILLLAIIIFINLLINCWHSLGQSYS